MQVEKACGLGLDADDGPAHLTTSPHTIQPNMSLGKQLVTRTPAWHARILEGVSGTQLNAHTMHTCIQTNTMHVQYTQRATQGAKHCTHNAHTMQSMGQASAIPGFH
jgi:uncharacterized membrane protein